MRHDSNTKTTRSLVFRQEMKGEESETLPAWRAAMGRIFPPAAHLFFKNKAPFPSSEGEQAEIFGGVASG